MSRRALLPSLIAAVASLASCGYHVGGQADLVPKSIQTISIPAFTTLSTRYKLVDVLPQQIGREFIARTRFRIVSDPSEADAVLSGSINAVTAGVSIVDPTTSKATAVTVTVAMTITLRERSTGRVLYSRPNFAAHETYNVAVDPHQFFDESGPAFDRLSRDVAHDIVSAIVEAF
jgi:outer membrane lipopolysaccharide assembly protein LptE/RlpB